MNGENKYTALFTRRLGLIDSNDPSIKKIEQHINYMQEQLEFKIRQYDEKIRYLERQIDILSGGGLGG